MTPRHRRYVMRSTSMLALIATMPPLTREQVVRVLEPWRRYLAMVQA